MSETSHFRMLLGMLLLIYLKSASSKIVGELD